MSKYQFVKYKGGNGYCGCDYEEYVVYEKPKTEEELKQISEEKCEENASSHCDVMDEVDREEFDTDQEYEEACESERMEYEENTFGCYEIITSEEYFDEMQSNTEYIYIINGIVTSSINFRAFISSILKSQKVFDKKLQETYAPVFMFGKKMTSNEIAKIAFIDEYTSEKDAYERKYMEEAVNKIDTVLYEIGDTADYEEDIYSLHAKLIEKKPKSFDD